MVYPAVGLSGSGSARKSWYGSGSARGGSAKLVYPELQKGSKSAGSGSARGGSAELVCPEPKIRQWVCPQEVLWQWVCPRWVRRTLTAYSFLPLKKEMRPGGRGESLPLPGSG